MPSLLSTEMVRLDADLGTDKDAVIASLADAVSEAGRATSATDLTADARAREAQSATGLPGGIAIPHCRSAAVTAASVAFARLSPGVDFGAPDGPADLVFMIAAPEGGDTDHLTLLSALARSLVRPEFTAALRAAAEPSEVVALVEQAVTPEPVAPTGAAAPDPVPNTGSAADTAAARTVVAVTACPTGIAHTYMAADSLVQAGERAGVTVTVETQGSSGSTPLAKALIDAADAVIFATDVGVRDKSRFAGKPVVASGVKRAINEPDTMVTEALAVADDPDGARVRRDDTAAPATAGSGGDVHAGVRLRQWLLTGVSYMIPFVAAGGLLIALGFLLGGYEISLETTPGSGVTNAADVLATSTLLDLPAGGIGTYLGAALFTVGSYAFSFLVPALAGYIAYAMADRPGIAPGFVVGLVAVEIGAGFLGGLVGGLLAGAAALYVSRLKVPAWGRGLMPVVVIPLLATVISSGLMLIVLGRPLGSLQSGLENWLTGLTGTSVLLLGLLLGAMMAFDLGGPVNKAAYVFATTGLNSLTATQLGSGEAVQLEVMAAVMAAGMVPPLALALATTVRGRLFTREERENGKAAWLLGSCFITEGAIPFAASDPLRVIAASMAGAATTAAIIMVAGATSSAPHGGFLVFFAINGLLWFLAAIAIGTLVSAALVVVLKQTTRREAAVAA